jgi:hypothetical protein
VCGSSRLVSENFLEAFDNLGSVGEHPRQRLAQELGHRDKVAMTSVCCVHRRKKGKATMSDMLHNVADAALERVVQYTIGFARAGDEPAAKGSGVLVRSGNLHGILTCAHVDDLLRKTKQPVGLVRFNRGNAQQFGTLNLDEISSHLAGEEPNEVGEPDISFLHIPPHMVGNIAKDCVFLDADKNISKEEPENREALFPVYSVFGLVESFTGATTRQGRMATTALKGVLTSGTPRDVSPVGTTLECFKENIHDLPDSFGGTSGGGLWRIYARAREDGSYEAAHHRLIGIASHEIRSSPPQIVCQGMGRMAAIIDEALKKNVYG